MPSNGYPPQFASSSLAALFGQINDLAGTNQQQQASQHALKQPQLQPPLKFGDPIPPGYSIPVEITGTADPAGLHIPGLREILIGVSIKQLLTQLPADFDAGTLIGSAEHLIDTGLVKLQHRNRPPSDHSPVKGV